MNYKERLIIEYKELIEKRTLLEKEIIKDTPIGKSILNEQLEAMQHYEEILFRRLCLLVNGEER